MAFHDLEKRPVGALVGILDDMIEVADRLVVVHAEYEADSG
jgi:hypothetical protein